MKKKPTAAELEILQILWESGASTVRFVNETINKRKTKEIGYTTTLKMMQLMHQKNMLQRESSGRTHIYEAGVSEEATQKSMLNKMLETTFKGSAMKMVMQLLGNRETTSEEFSQIRNYLNELEEQQEKD